MFSRGDDTIQDFETQRNIGHTLECFHLHYLFAIGGNRDHIGLIVQRVFSGIAQREGAAGVVGEGNIQHIGIALPGCFGDG